MRALCVERARGHDREFRAPAGKVPVEPVLDDLDRGLRSMLRHVDVHGRGGQTRAFIDPRDTVRCIELALKNPPRPGEFRVMNQFTEQWSVLELAERGSRVASALGIDAPVTHLANPRVESESHYHQATSSKLVDLGLEPHPLDDSTIAGLPTTAIRHCGRVRLDTMAARVDWRAVP